MFLGQYRHNLDSKGRLTVPARFRGYLSEGVYVTQGFDRNLMVLNASTFERLSQRINQMSLTDPAARELKRLLFAAADFVEPDKQGRILIPQFLRQIADINAEVVVVGVGEYFEIWSPEPWDPQQARLQDASANAQRFAALDLSTGD